ncbi:MAG: VanZ family protein [Lachnospiraceae bacterium]|nr:VanZ family protein [Lachnospiraceae bacterium]
MKSRDRIRLLSRIAFVIYMIVLVYFLLLSDGFGRTARHEQWQYNLIPFYEINRFLQYREIIGTYNVLLNLVGNVVAFIPFGALIRWVINQPVRCMQVVGYTFAFSLWVELLQLIAKVGSFDVDDLLLNTLGGLLGYWVYWMLKWMNKRRENHDSKQV